MPTMNNMENKELPEKQPEGKQKEKKQDPKKTALSYLHDFVYLVAAVLLVILLLFRIVVVYGPSMRDTLYHGDYLLVLNNVFYTNPQYGDIIVATKDSFENGEPIIKRVIATEGQWVDIDFENGIVYVDGVALDEPYIKTATNLDEGMEFPLYVEEGYIFVMGDNRNRSRDSRNPRIGLIERREIIGKVVFLVFPGSGEEGSEFDLNRIGVVS